MILEIRSLAINRSGDIFAGADWLGGVYRSTDNGDSWQSRGLENSTINCLVINSLDHVYAGTARDGIYRSQVGGAAWSQINNDLTTLNVNAIAINSSDTLFCGTDGGGVFRSINNGDSWAQTNSGLTDLNVQALATNSLDNSDHELRNNIINALYALSQNNISIIFPYIFEELENPSENIREGMSLVFKRLYEEYQIEIENEIAKILYQLESKYWRERKNTILLLNDLCFILRNHKFSVWITFELMKAFEKEIGSLL